MSKSNAEQATSNLNYQDDVNADLDRKHDLDATAADDEVDNEEISTDAANHVKAAIQKVMSHFYNRRFKVLTAINI